MEEAAPWVVHSGNPWRNLPDRLGPWPTAYHRSNTYRRDGAWAAVLDHRRKDELARPADPPPFDAVKYRGRNVIGRLDGRLEERRRSATRYEELAVNFRAMIQLASVL